MRRREFLTILILATAARAQALDAQRRHRIAVIAASSRGLGQLRTVLLPELQKLGFAENRNISLETHVAANTAELPALARDVVALRPDMVISIGSTATLAVREATASIPVLMYGTNPVGLGIAQSLSRPGGNVTGIAILAQELDGKRLELLHDLVPEVRRAAVLVNPSDPSTAASLDVIRERAAAIGVELHFVEATGPNDYEPAYAQIEALRADGIVIAANPQFAFDARILAQHAQERRLPTICQWREMAEEGCLFSYGPNLAALWRRMAEYVERILKGPLPGETPIEQPSRFELVVNGKTAKALALPLTPTLLVRADEVIE